MRLARLLTIITIVTLLFSVAACGGGKSSKLKASVDSDEPREGRDRELFEDALKEMQKKRYEQGRLLINTMVTTYGDSPLLPMAKLTIADSFYREGGSSNLAQAEAEYKDWLQFFPNNDLAPDVMIKMAEIHMRQVQSPDRDREHANLARKVLLELVNRFPQAKQNPKVQEYLELVEDKLARHDLGVAKFYFERRDAWKATESRCQEITEKYPKFTDLDTALWYLGRSLEEQENTEDAANAYARIVREFPASTYRDAAAEKLERFGKPVPDPIPGAEERISERRGMMSRVMENLFGPSLAVSKEGILLKSGDQIDETTYQLINNTINKSSNAPQSISNKVGQKPAQPAATDATDNTNNNGQNTDITGTGSADKPTIKEKKQNKKEKEKSKK